MYSAKNESRVRSSFYPNMNNTVVGNSSPTFLVPEVPAMRPMRIDELKKELLILSGKKKNPANRNTNMSSSTRKYATTTKKPAGLSQNMSTSKKLTVQKRSGQNGVKRSIDFSNLIKSEYPNLPFKSVSRQSIAPNNTKQIKNSPKNTYAISTERFSITNNYDPKTTTYPILKKTPKSLKKQNERLSPTIEEDSDSFNYNQKETLSNKKQSKAFFADLSLKNEFKTLLESNSKILTELMISITSLLQNNNKLIDLLNKNDSIKSIPIIDEPRIPKELFPIESDSDKENMSSFETYVGPSCDLRKFVLSNNEYTKKMAKVSIKTPPKESLQMYAKLKSNMKFLNTPRKDENCGSIETQTPNTRNRYLVSLNVQDQLKQLFDSPGK